jgi:preprotein translocase subunit SecF
MASDKLTTGQVLFPVALLSLVVTIFLGFQTTMLFSDRNQLQLAHTQQDKPLEQVGKIKAQLNALATGTLKLSEQGNKDAQNIIAELKKAGIDVSDQPQGQPAQPAMTAPPSAGR